MAIKKNKIYITIIERFVCPCELSKNYRDLITLANEKEWVR